MDKKKVLVLYNKLFHYRIPIFNILGEKYDLTVAYTEGHKPDGYCNFEIVKLSAMKLNRFVIHKDDIHKLCSSYDVIVCYGDIAWLKYSLLPFRKTRNYKVIFWSIGVSASYDKKFDASSSWDTIRTFFYKRADALVFYSDYPITKYCNFGVSRDKIFVAPNTVKVYQGLNESQEVKKDSILFIGTLYIQKGILTLLESYKKAYESNNNIVPLNLIGNGDESDSVKEWIVKNRLEKMIFLRGPIYDIQEKSIYFKKAYACISPMQAGLSVLESMGYGVPYVTTKDAITGGERLNIVNMETGLLMNNVNELTDIILDISQYPNKYIEMGNKAQSYYQLCRKPEDMALGLEKAIEYTLK